VLGGCKLPQQPGLFRFYSGQTEHAWLSHEDHVFAPGKLDNPKDPDFDIWKNQNTKEFEDMSIAVLADAADSIARIWLRTWRRVERWKET
jgi:hypothetical protein